MADTCEDDVREMFTKIVRAELDNWVPGASQRLLFRAGATVGLDQPDPRDAAGRDCGPDRGDHATFPDWVAGVYVHRCATCFRLYAA